MLRKILDEVTELMKVELSRRVEDYDLPQLVPLLRQSMFVKGVSDRALMVRLACEAVGGDWHEIVPAMAALELFDISLIVIDDFFDQQLRRMRKPTVFSKFGPRSAVIAGVALKSMSTRALIEQCQMNDSRSERIGKLITILEEAQERIYYGQHLDILFEELDLEKISQQMYLRMIEATTGAEISVATRVGSMIANGRPAEIVALSDLGLYTGIVFQIRDDLIDYVNDEGLIGKVPFCDVRRKKKRLPLILAYHLSGKRDKNLIEKILKKPSLDDKDIRVLSLFVARRNVIEKIQELTSQLKAKAEQALRLLPPSDAKRLLHDVLELGCSI